MTTLTLEEEGNVDKEKLDRFLQTLLWEKHICNPQGHSIEIMRLKVHVCYCQWDQINNFTWVPIVCHSKTNFFKLYYGKNVLSDFQEHSLEVK